MPWPNDALFDVKLIVAESGCRFSFGNCKIFTHHGLVLADTDTPPAPAPGGLNHYRVSDLSADTQGLFQVVYTAGAAGDYRHSSLGHDLLSCYFVTGKPEVLRCGADKNNGIIFAGPGKHLFFSQVPIAGMDGIGPGLPGCFYNVLYV